MDEQGQSVLIHQLLHGYQDGHTLIASSLNLDAENRRLLGVLTDMSGPTLYPGFEEYLTGYPLPSEGYYAISKTWYANEMPRPGSVWTHTLLISYSDLAKVENILDILGEFQRPWIAEKNYQSHYSTPLNVYLNIHSNLNISLSQPFVTENVLQALYATQSDGVIIKSRDSRFYESLLVQVWLQQWPRLRRGFTFCTGAIYPRTIQGKYFDLQVCPDRVERNVTVSQNLTIVDPEKLNDQQNLENWLIIACNDLQNPSPLRTFLRQYGPDVLGKREAFVKLVTCFGVVRDKNLKSIASLVETLSTIFPLESDAETLKLDLLQSNPTFTSFHFRSFQESEILIELASTEKYESFNFEKLNFIARYQMLYDLDRALAIRILNELLKRDLNVWGEKIFKLAAASLNAHEFNFFTDVIDKNLAFAVASQNEQLLYSPVFWQKYKTDHRELLSILIRYGESNKIDWIKIIDLLVSMNSSVASQIQSEELSVNLVVHILHWSNYHNSSTINDSWYRLLHNTPKAVVSWLKSVESISEKTLQIVIAVLNPNSKEVVSGGSHLWVNFLVKLQNSNDSELYHRASAFALALSFNRPDQYYLQLVSRSFEPVYYALKNGRINYEYWYPIELHTKSLPFYNDWDKCKKLIDALFYNFTDVRWTRSQIDVLFYTSEVRERVWHRYKKKFA